MLKKTKIKKPLELFSKDNAIKQFGLTQKQSDKIDKYIQEINIYNAHTNIVGKSTLIDPWKSHILDSVQIGSFIHNKNSTILDMGTGAGIPGLILAINNFKNVSLVDSNLKKIKFIKHVCLKLNIETKIYHQRIESLIDLNTKFDYLVSRALANLNKLLYYSQKLLKSDTVLIFLKGRHVNDEIKEARKHWSFHHQVHQSVSDERGSVIIIRSLNSING